MRPGGRMWVCLAHHPVLDRAGEIVTTSVTNLDVHDLARSGRTYGIAGLVVASPVTAQLELVEHVVSYWNDPAHVRRIPGRREALALVKTCAAVPDSILLVESLSGLRPVVIGTSARPGPGRTSHAALRRSIREDPSIPRLLLLGTGWGLAPEILDSCDAVLAPVEESSDYNHLSVRAAGAIILDRLLGST